MALLDLNITELCDWRTNTYNKAGYDLILGADPAVTTKLVAKLDAGQFHRTPYWRVCVQEAAKLKGYRCDKCGRHLAPVDVVGLYQLDLPHGTEHTNLDQIAVMHRNSFYCKANVRRAERAEGKATGVAA